MLERPVIPFGYAKTHGVAIASASGESLSVYVREGAKPAALSELRRSYGRPISATLLSPERFDATLTQLYGESDAGGLHLADEFAQGVDLARLVQELPRIEDLLESQDDAPIIRMINAILVRALKDGASDIHIEPYESRSVTRLRIDGVLRDVLELNRALHAAIVSRIKIMAQLDIAEKRLPQDGRISVRLAGKPVDVRVSTLPTGHAERVVLRLLDKEAGRFDLGSLGMSDSVLVTFRKLIAAPHGMILVTGPTGSGKTTTLYAALGEVDTGTLNVMTVEDPIEYYLEGIGQTQVNPRIEMTFARALRAILRQDPDVVMIGEIRDVETAQIAIQASLTGHLVLATLHTNDAAGAVTRLIDMGIEPFLLSSTLLGVAAQRLIRRLCEKCRLSHVPDPAEVRAMQVDPVPALIYRAAGCPACNQTGYRGRTGLYETFHVDDAMRGLIHDGAPEQAMREHALRGGMQTLRQDAMRWVRSGATTLEEVLRVTRD